MKRPLHTPRPSAGRTGGAGLARAAGMAGPTRATGLLAVLAALGLALPGWAASAPGTTAAASATAPAAADAVARLRGFVRNVQAASASFTQTVTSPDGRKVRQSQGEFAFQRPDRFRFHYTQPYEQLIVGDGRQVWLLDPDLNQVTVRPISQALGASPAALLAGRSLEAHFTLHTMPPARAPSADLQWAEALPRVKDGQYQSIRVGFRNGTLAALEIIDGFGQRSRLNFTRVETHPSLPASTFEFRPPPGVEVLQAPAEGDAN